MLTFGACQQSNEPVAEPQANHANVILIFTDDQGIGDIGYNGNPYILTPNLDSLARSGVILENFYASPVCTPSRASLLTGKFSMRTGVFDTYNAGAIMNAEQLTLAEVLRKKGYATAVFGKWHLGDHYPFRPSERGFEYSLIHKSGGVGQPGDPDNYFDFDSSYFDPVLYENNLAKSFSGYCSDVYTDKLLEFLDSQNQQPFFAYLAFNAPHTPLQVPDVYYQMYDTLQFTHSDTTFMRDALTAQDLEDARRIYAMISNIDHNVGRVINKLKENDQLDNTLIIYLSDNGPQQNRYRMGLRGAKGTVYEGGIKVPAFINGSQINSGRITTVLSHIDLMPTLLDYLQQPPPEGMDGSSFKDILLNGEVSEPEVFRERALYHHWNRGFPQRYRNIAIRKGAYKMVGQSGLETTPDSFELFDLDNDPNELRDISEEHPGLVEELKKQFDGWFEEAFVDGNLQYLRSVVGSEQQTQTILTRNDARGVPAVWRLNDHYFFWDIAAAHAGLYSMSIRFEEPLPETGRLMIRLAPYQRAIDLDSAGIRDIEVDNFYLDEGPYTVECGFQGDSGKWIFPFTVTINSPKATSDVTN